MCKSEYKLIRKMQWDGDVLKVQDTMHDVLREAKQAAEDAMTGEVLSHFECDFSDFREYMHDKIKWEQKQWAAMPRWIPVTERLPEKARPVVLAVIESPCGRKYVDMLYYLPWLGVWSESDDEYQMIGEEGDVVTHWMPLPEPPKEEI